MEGEGENDVNINKTEDENQMYVGKNNRRSRKNMKKNVKNSISTVIDIEDKGHENLKIPIENVNSNTEEQQSFNLNSNVSNEKQSINDKIVDSTRKSRTTMPKRKRSLSTKGNEKIKNCENNLGSLLLNRINCGDIQINTSTDDVEVKMNVSVPPDPDSEVQHSESPESKKKRIEIVSRQCRLHPSNEKYNQGPVLNPPLISPGTVVGYTPAGQRHEVDLNFDRPTWFNSEYARMQFDDATRINVSRMMHELSQGWFLPATLNADVEKQYFKEKALITEEATRHFEDMKKKKETSNKEVQEIEELKKTDKMKFLETERRLIELIEFAVVKINDFPSELSKKICEILREQMTPLMFLKNPIIVETIDKLTRQRIYRDVSRSARFLNDKIKVLFDVPQSQTFHQYFQSEVKRLEEKTKDMSKFDLAVMTEESEIVTANTKCTEGLEQGSENVAKEEEKPKQTSAFIEAKEEENPVLCFSVNTKCTEGLEQASENVAKEDPVLCFSENTKCINGLEQASENEAKEEEKPELTSAFIEIEEEWVPVEDNDNWYDVSNDDDTNNLTIEGSQDEEDVVSGVVSEFGQVREMPDDHISENRSDHTYESRDAVEDAFIENPEE